MRSFTRYIITTLLLSLCSLGIVAAQVQLTADGPYIIYENEGARVVAVDVKGAISNEVLPQAPQTFEVVSSSGQIRFEVALHQIRRPEWKREAAPKTLVISDPHGNIECFVSVLQGNGVIDKDLHWSYGRNSLVIIGDIADRGADATQIYWLCYKLEAEAEQAGGRLSFLYGNHEPMLMAGDLRYTHDKYIALADTLGTTVPQLMARNTELGRWLEARNTMQIEGDALFVHAGISKELLDKHYSIPYINSEVSRGLFMTSKERKADSEELYFLFRTFGPVWYRGMVRHKSKYHPVDKDTVEAILTEYGVSRIYVGHTIFRNVRTFYGKRVIAVNVDNQTNHDKHRSRGILIEGESYSIIGDNGRIK